MNALNGITVHYLHQNIRYLRKKLNISQEELAAQIGLNRGNIASYENGSAEPRICNLLKLAQLFGVSITDLTQKDLTQEATYEAAHHAYQSHEHTSEEERQEVLTGFQQRSEELMRVMESLHTCHQFKLNSLETLSKDARMMSSHFEQMYELALKTLSEYQDLLHYVRCQDKPTTPSDGVGGNF